MTFLNFALALGAVTLAAPLLIHLLNRSRFKTVDWGAMHLLEAATRINSRRIQWMAWLLLLLRCMIPLLLAFALARPVLTAWKRAGGEGPASVVLLVDNSFSMDAPSQADTATSALDHAIAQATQIARQLPSGSDFTVLTGGGQTVALTQGAVVDPRQVEKRFAELRRHAGGFRAAPSLDQALAAFDSMNHARRHLVLLSDFQSRDWDSFQQREYAAFQGKLANAKFSPRLTLIPVSSDLTANLSISIQAPPTAYLAVAQPQVIRVNVFNHGDAEIEQAQVIFTADGVDLASKQIRLPSKAETLVTFACQFDSPGLHPVSVRVQDDSTIHGDDQAHFVFDVLAAIPVLIVDGDPQRELLRSESGFMQLALAPWAFAASDASSSSTGLFKVHVLSADSLKDDWIDQAEVIVLANVKQLRGEAAERLEASISSGKTLIVFPGDRIDHAWYNQRWAQTTEIAAPPLLPAAFSQLAGSNEQDDQWQRLRVQPFDHPALDMFNQNSQEALGSIEVKQWYQLQLVPPISATTEESKVTSGSAPTITPVRATVKPASSTARVLMSLVNGDPLLIEQPYGEGMVQQWATTCDDLWTNLPLRPAYLPLMQQMLLQAAARHRASFNGRPGQSIAWSQPAERKTTQPATEQAAVVADPQGVRRELTVDREADESNLALRDTSLPGLYTITGLDDQPTFIAVNEPEEGGTQRLSDAALTELAGHIDAEVVGSATEFLRLEQLRSTGKEIWRWLLIALVVLLFAELLLQQRLSGKV